MAPEQRNDEFSSEPWELSGAQRDVELTWFIGERDLARPESLERLRERTGRTGIGGFGARLADDSVWVQIPDESDRRDLIAMVENEGDKVTVTEGWLPPSRERGRHVPLAGRPCPPAEFVAYYQSIQNDLQAAQRTHHAYLEKKRRRSRGLALGGQFAILSPFLQDARLDAVYTRVRYGRGSASVLAEPLRGDHRALSYVGVVALAMFHRLVRSRESVVCPSCGELEFFEDTRHRDICSKPECRKWYRAKWARADYAAAKTARKAARRDKTGKR